MTVRGAKEIINNVFNTAIWSSIHSKLLLFHLNNHSYLLFFEAFLLIFWRLVPEMVENDLNYEWIIIIKMSK
jgi:hypothetical protein